MKIVCDKKMQEFNEIKKTKNYSLIFKFLDSLTLFLCTITKSRGNIYNEGFADVIRFTKNVNFHFSISKKT